MSFWGFGTTEVEEECTIDMTSPRNFVAGSTFDHVDAKKEKMHDITSSSSSKDSSSDKASNCKDDNNTNDTVGKDDTDIDMSHSWINIDASEFNLRVGPNYKRTGTKAPSGTSLYELVGLDIIQSPKRIDDIASKVILPNDWTTIESNHPNIPPVFVVNAQLPSSFDTSLFKEIGFCAACG